MFPRSTWIKIEKNIRLIFLSGDDFPGGQKITGAKALNAALERGWPGFEISEQNSAGEAVRAIELMERPVRSVWV
jgi:hypothetical protein